MVGQVPANLRALLTADATRLIVPVAGAANGQATATVATYDGATAQPLGTIASRPISADSADDVAHGVDPYISPDGRWLALVHSVWKTYGVASKETRTPARRAFTHAVELLDLTATRSSGFVSWPDVTGASVMGEHLVWSADSQSLYAFSRRFDGSVFTTSIAVLSASNGVLTLMDESTDDEATVDTVVHAMPGRYMQKVAPDNRTLVRYVPGPRLQWFDLIARRTVASVMLPVAFDLGQRLPPLPIPAFAADMSAVAVATPGTGDVRAFDLITGRLIAQRTLPGVGQAPRHPAAGIQHTTVTASPAGHLYVTENRGQQGGTWSLALPSLAVERKLQPSGDITAVVTSRKGDVVHALDPSAGTVTSMDTKGDVAGTASAPTALDLVRAGATIMGD